MSNDGKLKSGQMLVLLRILPFVFESLEDNACVQLIITFIEIVQIVFAPVIFHYNCVYVEVANLKSKSIFYF